VGPIGLPFSERDGIGILGLRLPLQPDSTIVASLAPTLPVPGSLRLKVEEIAPSDEKAASQTASVEMLIVLARGFTAPLADNAANNGLKELLKSAEVAQRHDRVVITATLPSTFLAGLEASADSSPAVTP
jgi:hypothetical protein